MTGKKRAKSKPKAKMGRPRKAESKRQPVAVKAYLTEVEAAELQEAVDRSGRSLSQYVREHVMAAVRRDLGR